MPENYDRRRHPVRADLAARDYEGLVPAERFVDGVVRQVVVDRLALRSEPRQDKSIDTEALRGEWLTVYEETAEGWSWGQLDSDGYVGWFSTDGLGAVEAATHRVRAVRSFVYPGADLKLPPLGYFSIGSKVTVRSESVTRGLAYARLSDGSYVVAKHLVPLDHEDADWVNAAEDLLGTPYLWGGRSSLGLDCSALVQLAAQTGGIDLPRDSDMQANESGYAIDYGDLSTLRRGDLLFWKGHVGIISGPNKLLHSNGFTMTVAYESLDEAVARIAANEWGLITGARRLRPEKS